MANEDYVNVLFFVDKEERDRISIARTASLPVVGDFISLFGGDPRPVTRRTFSVGDLRILHVEIELGPGDASQSIYEKRGILTV